MPDKPRVAGIRFRNAGKILYFDTAGMRLEVGEYVIVETARGPQIGRVVIAPDQVVVNELNLDELRPILRLAIDDDIRKMDGLQQRAHALLPEARRVAEKAGFPAHIDSAEFTLDGKRLTLSFTSEERLDYRDFVRTASQAFGLKVDMHQEGARDRARDAGGYGICGRELCCASWLVTFPSISIRMAKEQDLSLNPQKISGLCGRLLCCLSYEEDGYRQMRKTLPRIGQRCSTPTGEGKVIALNILRRQITLLVDGQRVDVADRDLGTAVRWDTSSKSGEPPPSLSLREEAISASSRPAEEEVPQAHMVASSKSALQRRVATEQGLSVESGESRDVTPQARTAASLPSAHQRRGRRTAVSPDVGGGAEADESSATNASPPARSRRRGKRGRGGANPQARP